MRVSAGAHTDVALAVQGEAIKQAENFLGKVRDRLKSIR